MQDYAVKVASYHISQDKAEVKSDDNPEVSLYECKRDTQEIERISDAVREAAYYEERDTKHKRKILSLTCKLYSRSHYESASDCQETALEATCSKP